MSMLGTKTPIYDDGRTKQSFRDETDINKLLQRAQKTGTISHLNKHEARYGDFSGFDFFEAQLRLTAGREIFDELPSEVRNEFQQSPAAFFKYVNDPANSDRLESLLPALAAPGRQMINLLPDNADEAAATASNSGANATVPPDASGGTDAAPEAPTSPEGDSSDST